MVATVRSTRRRRDIAATSIALLAVVAFGSSALAGYWNPTRTLRTAPADNEVHPSALSASGRHVAAGWRETIGGKKELWVRESVDSGSIWMGKVRLVGDPNYAARDLSLDSGPSSHWAAWSERRPIAGHPARSLIILASKPFGAGAWDNIPVSAAGDGTRYPTVAATPSRIFVIYRANVAGTTSAVIQDTRTDTGIFGAATTLGAAPGSHGHPHLDATSSTVSAVWSDGQVRLKRGLIGGAPGYAVAWQTTQTLGAGDSPLVAVGGTTVAVFYHVDGDVWVRVSSNSGVSFGSAQKLLDGDPPHFFVFFAESAAIAGSHIVLSAASGGDAFGAGHRVTSNNGGSTWSTVNSNGSFADGRRVAFTTEGLSLKLAELWLADLFEDSNRIVFHRQD